MKSFSNYVKIKEEKGYSQYSCQPKEPDPERYEFSEPQKLKGQYLLMKVTKLMTKRKTLLSKIILKSKII